MEDEFDALKKSINQRKLLNKAGKGDLEKVKCLILKDKVDVNFADEYGSTALHYAVKNGKLDVIRWLVKQAKADVIVETNKNKTPLDIARDIAREVENQEIIDLLVEKIIDDAFEVLEDFANINKPGRPSTETASKRVDEKIKQTEDKIESCLEFLKKINADAGGADQENISYHQANILIYCIETFSLDGDKDKKEELKKYFSQYYTELDRKVFSDVRTRLLKTSGKTIMLEDIRTFINGDVKSFFIKLEEYVQYVRDVKELRFFLEDMASKLRDQGPKEIDQFFLRDSIVKWMKKSEMKGETKSAAVLDFTAQFYPAFQKTRDGCLRKPSDEDVEAFLIELQEYVQYIQQLQQLGVRRSEEVKNAPGTSLLDKLTKGKGSNLKKDITLPTLFDFIVHFYPAFHEHCNNNKRLDVLVTKIKKYIKCGRNSESLNFLLDRIKSHNGDVKSFLEEQIKTYLIKSGRPDGVLNILQEYVQRTRQEGFFLKTFQGDIGKKEDVGSYVKEEFEKLMVTSYTEENITAELLFNFVVNFYPAFQKETQADLRELSSLRNNLIHDFHKYGAMEFGKAISGLRHTLFKYYFAQEVNQALRAIEPDEDPEITKETLRKKLESFKDKYVINKKYFIPTDEADDFFGYRLSQFLFSERADHPEELVDQYWKFMVFIDCAQDSPIDNEEDQNPQLRKELDALGRREIFEGFCRLRRIRKHSNGNSNYYDEEKLKLRKRLLDEYGVPSHHFDRICSSHIENGSREIGLKERTEIKNISDTIKSLGRMKNDHKFPNRVVIFLYDECLNNKDSFGSEEHRKLMGRDKFNHEWIINKFKHLPSDEIMDVPIGEEILYISRGKVISNILNTFYNAYHAYTIQYDIEEIFNDETFLDYLVKKETEVTEEKLEVLVDSNSINEKPNVKPEAHNYIRKLLKAHNYMIIRKLLKVADYTAPYIVRLITKEKSDAIIEKDDLVRLVEILLMKKKYSYIKSLNELLKLESEKLNLYEEVCDKITDPSFDIYSMHFIFEESQHVEGILTFLIERIKLKSDDKMIEVSRKVLKVLVNSDVLKFVRWNCEKVPEICNRGLELIKVIKPTSDGQSREPLGGNESNDSIVAAECDINLKMAKAKNYQGIDKFQPRDPDQAKTCYIEALTILNKIPDTVHPQSLLALSRKAYTNYLLKDYDAAYQTWEDLYKKMVEFVCDSYGENTEFYTKEIYKDIESSEKYKILLASSDEYNKYLDILDIRYWMARNLELSGVCHKKIKDCKKALEIYKEIHSYEKLNLRPRHYNAISNESWTARAHMTTSSLMFEQKNYQDALEHSEYGLLKNVSHAKIQKNRYGNFHPLIKVKKEIIEKNLHHIASSNNGLGDAESTNDRKKRFYEKALTLYDKIHAYQKRYLGEGHKYIWKTSCRVESIRKKLDNITRGCP